jgi:hypothetical protein
MTLFKSTDGVVVGQPMSPSFGAQNGRQGAAAPTIQQPTTAPVTGGMQATGVQMSVLEACSRGLIPRNAQLSTIAGQSVSAGISALQGDGVSVDEALSSGNGTQVNLGVAVPPNAGNNAAVETMGVNNQIMVEGAADNNGALSTGPTPTNTESVVSAPLAGSTTTANVTLLAGVYQG